MIKRIKNAIFWCLMRFKNRCVAFIIHEVKATYYEIKTRITFPSESYGKSHELPEKLIISLTSYPPRFPSLALTIKCLLRQSVRPDKVILWIAEDDVLLLPQSVKALVSDDDFEIRVCEDIGSYKKIIPTLKLFPDAFIVTADDDLYYTNDWLEKLIDDWDGDYKNIVAHRIHRIRMDKNNTPLPYNEWEFEILEGDDVNFHFATSGAGILYPPKSFDTRVMDKDIFMDICSNADDVWLFWMSRLNGGKTTKSSYDMVTLTWRGSQSVALFHDNVLNNQNDCKINAMIDKFGWVNI